MTQRPLSTALVLLLTSPWARAHPGHGQGLGHLHHSLAQALADWPVALAAAFVAGGLAAAWLGWRRHRADKRQPRAVQPPN